MLLDLVTYIPLIESKGICIDFSVLFLFCFVLMKILGFSFDDTSVTTEVVELELKSISFPSLSLLPYPLSNMILIFD